MGRPRHGFPLHKSLEAAYGHMGNKVESHISEETLTLTQGSVWHWTDQALFLVTGVHGLGLWAAHLTFVLLKGAMYLGIISLEVICFTGMSERI